MYSNLAAALCKLGKYDDAYEAAEKATKVDPDWSKGHWRLGSVLELQKSFMHAVKSYETAVELAPDEGVYSKALGRMMQRIGCGEKDEEGVWTVDLPITSVHKSDDDPPCYVLWERIMKKTNNLSDCTSIFPEYANGPVTSEQVLGQALIYWHRALMRQMSEMTGFATDQQANKEMTSKINYLKSQMMAGKISKQIFDMQRYQITGLPPTQGDEFSDLMNALTCTAGESLPLEMGGGKLLPSPPWLEGYGPQQFMAVQMIIYYGVIISRNELLDHSVSSDGEDLVLSEAICTMARSFFANMGNDSKFQEGDTPEAAIDYIKKKLRDGRTWENGILKYVSFLYRGTVLSAYITRLIDGLGSALKQLKWARKFITLADDEWKVSANETYEKNGATFRKTFQVNIIGMELITAYTLRNNDTPNLEAALYEWYLAQEIINIAKKQVKPTDSKFHSWMFYTVFSRQPIARACSSLASSMNLMKDDPELLKEVLEKTGAVERGRDDNLISFITETVTPEDRSVVDPMRSDFINILIVL